MQQFPCCREQDGRGESNEERPSRHALSALDADDLLGQVVELEVERLVVAPEALARLDDAIHGRLADDALGSGWQLLLQGLLRNVYLVDLLRQKISDLAAKELTGRSSLLNAHLFLILLISCVSLSINARVIGYYELFNSFVFSNFSESLRAPSFDI